MPDRKSVLPVSTLCVERITQLLIELITVSKYTAKKAIPPIKREAITGTRVRNAMARMSASHHRHLTGNGPQQPQPQPRTPESNRWPTPLDSMLEPTAVNTPPASPPQDNSPPDPPSLNSASESAGQGTPSNQSVQDISPKSPGQSIPPSPPQGLMLDASFNTAQDPSSESTQDPSSETTPHCVLPSPPSPTTQLTKPNMLTPEERQRRKCACLIYSVIIFVFSSCSFYERNME